jgi:hypothetical protein
MKKTILTLLTLFLAYAATGWFLAPLWVEKSLKQKVSDEFGLELDFENLLLYPFNFSTQIENLVLLDKDGRALFTASSVTSKTSAWSFWRQAGRFGSLVVEQPRFHVFEKGENRLRTFQFLNRLVKFPGHPETKTRIASLSLNDMQIVVAGRSDHAENSAILPLFDFRTGSLGDSLSGPFQLTIKPPDQAPLYFAGEATWPETGILGLLRFQGDGSSLTLRSSGNEGEGESGWRGVSIEAPFIASVQDESITFSLQNAKVLAESVRLIPGQLAGIEAEKLPVNVSVLLEMNPDDLILKEVVAHSGGFRVSGLNTGHERLIEIPVTTAELTVRDYVLGTGRAVPFKLLMQTSPVDEVLLSGQVDVSGGSSDIVMSLSDVPLGSLINPRSGVLPHFMAEERLSANGRVHLSGQAVVPKDEGGGQSVDRKVNSTGESGDQPILEIVLAGRFASQGAIDLSAMTYSSDLSQDSHVELEVSGMDANLVSSWAEGFSGQRIASGSLGAHLGIRASDGRMAGRYQLSVEGMERIDARQLASGPADFIVALLQDADGLLEFSIPLDGGLRRDERPFSRWLQDETEKYLLGVSEKPFQTLGKAIGTDSEILQSVMFEPGEAGLSLLATDHLGWLKTALQWRPGLALRVNGGYDPEADKFALAEQQIQLHVNLATAADSNARAGSGMIDFGDSKSQIVLDEFAGSRLGKDRVGEIARHFMLDEKSLEPEFVEIERKAFYRALYTALVENEQISERALRSLARFRARTVIDQLKRNGIDVIRLEVGEQEAVKRNIVKGVPSPVEWMPRQADIMPGDPMQR